MAISRIFMGAGAMMLASIGIQAAGGQIVPDVSANQLKIEEIIR